MEVNITGRRSQLSSIHWVNSWLHSMLIRAEASREYYSCLQRTYASFIYLAQMVKKPTTCNAGDLGSIPASEKSPGDGNGYPLHYSYLENSMDRGAWGITVHGNTTELPTLYQIHFKLLRTQQYGAYILGREDGQ